MWSFQLVACSLAAAFYNFVRFGLPGGDYIWPALDAFLLMMCDVVRLFCGHGVAAGIEQCKRPEKRLVLYEFEGCQFCRRVRETMSHLDLDYLCFPCPRESLRQRGLCINSKFRPDVLRAGKQLSFPYLEDPNTNTKMNESADIIKYLWQTYGDKATPSWRYNLANSPLWFQWSSKLILMLRPCTDMGVLRAPAHKALEPLEFWGYESSPFVRRVREKLSMLELPYVYHNIPHGSGKRDAFRKLHATEFHQQCVRRMMGWVQVPYLRDPNAGIGMFESSDIVAYLQSRYQTAPPPSETWLDYGRDDKRKAH